MIIEIIVIIFHVEKETYQCCSGFRPTQTPRWNWTSESETETSPQSYSRRINSMGRNILSNGSVSMRSLDLCSERPSKSTDPDALKLFNASLMLSKSFQFFSLVLNGKHLPVEKVRDEDTPSHTHDYFAFRGSIRHERCACAIVLCKDCGAGQRLCYWTGKEPPAVHALRIVRNGDEVRWTISARRFLRHVTFLPAMRSRSILDW